MPTASVGPLVGSEKLKKQLENIRQSISKFEKQLNEGAARKQKENDAKFEDLRRRINSVDNQLGNETVRVRMEVSEMSERAEDALKLLGKGMTDVFNKRLIHMTEPVSDWAKHCEALTERLDRVQQDRTNSIIRARLAALRAEVGDLAAECMQYQSDQDALEKETIRKLKQLSTQTQRQIEMSVLTLNEHCSELRSRHLRDHPEELEDLSRVPELICSGEAVEKERFEMYVVKVIEVLNSEITQNRNIHEYCDENIIRAVQQYIISLEKKLQAAECVKSFAESIARDS